VKQMRSGSGEGSFSRLVDFCITHLWAESNKEEEEGRLFRTLVARKKTRTKTMLNTCKVHELKTKTHSMHSGDATPCRLTGVTLHSNVQ